MPSEAAEFADGQVQPLLDALRGFAGITIPVRKKTMVLFRLRKRLAELDHPPIDRYLDRLGADKKERQIFINLLTTNETSFFRTRRIWDFFQREFLVNFHRNHPSALLRTWSAAASTGEEACSIAMSCLEFQLQHPDFRFQILATDIDTDVLVHAESGIFRASTIDRLNASNPALMTRYFKPAEQGGWRADPAIRRAIRFAPHNLMTSPRALMPQDVIFLRNVLIYFRESEQSRIVDGIAEWMTPGSILILGESESLSNLEAPFDFVQPQIYRRAA